MEVLLRIWVGHSTHGILEWQPQTRVQGGETIEWPPRNAFVGAATKAGWIRPGKSRFDSIADSCRFFNTGFRDLSLQPRRDPVNWTIIISGRNVAPFDTGLIHRSHIP
jgi:hypothetical protein